MSDHIPRTGDEIGRSLLDDFDFPRDDEPSQSYSSTFFTNLEDDTWLKAGDQRPSPIRTDTATFPDTGGLTFNETRQIGVVTPSMQSQTGCYTNADKDTQLIESSRSNILSIISLLNEYVISHPFIVIRRQAQVNNRSRMYHLTPFTVIPFMLRIQNKQGIGAFFKGLPSVLVNYVLLIGSESFFYNLLQFPIEYDFSFQNLLSVNLLKHLAIKSLSILVVTPFICSSAVETVQSLIVGETPYPLEHIKEGLLRLFHFKNDRKLPIYKLLGPSLVYHLSYYLLYSLIRHAIMIYYFERKNEVKPTSTMFQESQFFANEKSLTEDQVKVVATAAPTRNATITTDRMMNELKASLYANLMTDIILYPFQNILYRLFLQGTRTLIDNADGQTAVIPLITSYDSVVDCYQTVVHTEGACGLFKGFGALILQYSFQASIIHLTNYCLDFLLSG